MELKKILILPLTPYHLKFCGTEGEGSDPLTLERKVNITCTTHVVNRVMLSRSKLYKNKDDNIHKNEVQNIGFGIPIEFLSQRKELFKSVQNQRNLTLVVQTVIWGKYNIEY